MPQTHPQLLPSAHSPDAVVGASRSSQTSLYFMRTLGDGMGGMTHENDIRIAEGLQNIDAAGRSGRGDGRLAQRAQRRRRQLAPGPGLRLCPTSTTWIAAASSTRSGSASRTTSCCRTYSSASSYRIRPLGPEETLFEIWSLTRYPERPRHRASPHHRSRWRPTTRAGRRFPPRTSPTCRGSRKACTPRGFEYMRLSNQIEGLISNFERVIDGFLAGLPYERAGARDPEDQHHHRRADRRPRASRDYGGAMSAQWDQSVDLLIAGSGGGGMVAALAALDCGHRAADRRKAGPGRRVDRDCPAASCGCRTTR